MRLFFAVFGFVLMAASVCIFYKATTTLALVCETVLVLVGGVIFAYNVNKRIEKENIL